MKFTKMHGCGNDYIYFDGFSNPEVENVISGPTGPEIIRQCCDRHRGIGADGVILIARPARDAGQAHVRMRMFNSDGSEAEMCGNGVRCVARYAIEHLGVACRAVRVHTGAGVLSVECLVDNGLFLEATVDHGHPILELERIPAKSEAFSWTAPEDHEYGIETGDRSYAVSLVSLGNPHAVIFGDASGGFTAESLRAFPVDRVGPLIERHQAFPRRTNVHFVAVVGRSEAFVRSWERGAGMTLACGTGSCAVAVAGVLTRRFDEHAPVRLHLEGGDLRIRWAGPGHRVFMTGPATEVFNGEWPDSPGESDRRS